MASACFFGGLGCSEEHAPPAPTRSTSGQGDVDAGVSGPIFSSSVRSGGSSTEPEPGVEGAEVGESCGTDADCKEGATCYQGTCVGDGALRFSLSWTLDTDLDLHVLTPSGSEISYRSPFSEGGELDVDDCVGAICREPGRTHVENVFWRTSPPTGEYTFWAHNYSEEFVAGFQIEVSRDERVALTRSGNVPLIAPFESMRFTYSY